MYRLGTHRLFSPKQTLANITPQLSACGITRCAEVTGLDVDLGVPTYCAIRPAARLLQTSNGKGLTPESAQVSALMEAIELHHAENPEPQCLHHTSLNRLTQQGCKVSGVEPLLFNKHQYFSNDYMLDWIEGEELIAQTKLWLPASAVYFCEPSVYRTSTNGLASGNSLLEASLHALYELIERDAISKVDVEGRLKIKERCRVINTNTITDEHLPRILDKIQQAQSKLVLLWVQSCLSIHTFWAVLLNQAPFHAVSTVNVGYGTHFDINVAATRAVTEAIQSRVTFIHGSREDIIEKPVYQAENTKFSQTYRYFDQLKGDTTWQAISDQVSYRDHELAQSYAHLLAELAAAGHHQVIRANLTSPQIAIPVVKMIVPSLHFKRKLF